MGFDLKYNIKHIGDIFVNVVQKTADSAIQCSKGVFSAYDASKLEQKKQQIAREIGNRVAQLLKEGTSDVTRDATLAELVDKLNSIEADLTEYESKKFKLENPFKTKKTECECTTTCEGKE
jgi:hypothetical protein